MPSLSTRTLRDTKQPLLPTLTRLEVRLFMSSHVDLRPVHMEEIPITALEAHSINVAGEDSNKVDLDHKEVVVILTTRTVDVEVEDLHPEDEASALQMHEPTYYFLSTSVLPTFRHHLTTLYWPCTIF